MNCWPRGGRRRGASERSLRPRRVGPPLSYLCGTRRARVAASIAKAAISSVNFSEVVAKLSERGATAPAITTTLDALRLDVVAFDIEQAVRAGYLRVATRPFGLSFGDRACLALAQARQAIVLTADRSWTRVRIGVTIETIR